MKLMDKQYHINPTHISVIKKVGLRESNYYSYEKERIKYGISFLRLFKKILPEGWYDWNDKIISVEHLSEEYIIKNDKIFNKPYFTIYFTTKDSYITRRCNSVEEMEAEIKSIINESEILFITI